MVVEIKVPSAGESVSEAVVAAIMKESGSYVEKDEEILELETDKVNQVVHAPEAGVLTLLVKVDETVTIDQVIGTIDTAGKATSAPPPPAAEKKEAAAPPPPTSTPLGEGARRTPESFVASIGQEKAPPPPSSAPTPATPPTPTPPKSAPVKEGSQTRKRMSGLRRTIAKRLVEVKNNTAMLTTFNEVDMSAVMELRSREKDAFLDKHGVKLGFMSFFVKACVAALKELPDVNAFIDGEEIVYNHSYHVGISVSTEKGLMVPVIRDCDNLSFAGIEQAIQDYAKKARSGSISIDDLQGGSFTITNGGVFGSMLSTPILNPPQSAILGMHNIVKRAVVINEEIVIRPMMYLALSYDHRIVDGKEAVTFLVKVKELLEKPDRLLFDF
ncbi:dihydrolipoyllysine-residue succinyltransferase [Simkania sp.]|uniref:dihydrolipoyllysine-residue succinyltransferase n=1 Tax=Simkania sp. TaxID=34094 RepID=UPI003B5175C2